MIARSRSHLLGAACLLLFTLLLWLHPLVTLRLTRHLDIQVHLRWAEQFLAALAEGRVLPRWASASHDGLGDPSFLYYQPLFYYLSSAFSLLGLGPERSLLLAAMTPYLLLGCLVYFSILAPYPRRHAMLGALFVLACPILYFLSTHMAGFPWTLALPFCVLFAAESTRERPRPLRLGILLCLICLSHVLSALMVLCCTGLARLFFAFPNRRTGASHVNWGLGVVLGLGLAAFFLYPALSQLQLITPDGWTSAFFNWRKFFALPIFSYATYGLYWLAIQWPLPLVVLVVCSLVLAPRRRAGLTPGQVNARRLAMVALAALALSTELAYPLYAILPPLRLLQFPFRFVYLAMLLANIALMIDLNERAWSQWGGLARIVAVLLIVAQCAMGGYLQWSLYRTGVRMPDRTGFMAGSFGQPEYVPEVSGPDWKAYVRNGKLAGECQRVGIRCGAINARTHDFSVVIDTARAVSVRLPIFAFPAWRLTVNGLSRPLVPDPATGLPVVQLAPGRHALAMTWSRMPAETTGIRITAGALCIVLGALAMAAVRRRRARLACPGSDAPPRAESAAR